ncbi:MAG: hypothetical protein HY516_01615 [Candidatus Aenigmarchaeota archaeon]|nr:hypothetical protein [Candidatus Aenigmarchaeota archaeon]
MRLALLGIILAVIVSGCSDTGGGSSGGSTGGSVAIKSFSADETALQGNDRASLSAEIVNTGDSKATSVKIQLLDLDVVCAQPGTGCDATETQWGITTGKKSDTISDLRINTPGEEAIPKQYSWRVQAPKLPANLKQSYQATARVSFGYSTTAVKQIKLVTLSEYQRLKTQGQTLPVTTSQPSNGPLKIDVRVSEPVRIEDSSTTFMMVVEATNLANGNTFLGADPNDVTQWNRASLKVTMPTGLAMVDTTGDCASIVSAGSLAVDLSKGKSYKIACEVKTTSNVVVSIDKTVSVKADYGYFADAKLSQAMEVTGKASYVVVAPGQTTTTVAAGSGGATPTTDTEAPAAISSATFSISPAIRDTNTNGKFIVPSISFVQPSDNTGVASFDIIVDKTQPTSDCGNCAALARITSPAAKSTGDVIVTGQINNLDQQSTYYVTVRAKDAAGNVGPVITKSVQTGQY